MTKAKAEEQPTPKSVNKKYVNFEVTSSLKTHQEYFLKLLELVPEVYHSQQQTRTMLIYFCVNSLDILNSLNLIPQETKKRIITYIRNNFQTFEYNNEKCSGFSGSSSYNFNPPHITITYTSILVLKTLDSDFSFSEEEKKNIINYMKYLQRPNGSFLAVLPHGAQFNLNSVDDYDARFAFCACQISFLLQNFSGIDIPKVTQYFNLLLTYEGGYGMSVNEEAHSGTTYCAVAGLFLLDEMQSTIKSNPKLERFLALKYSLDGVNGRTNKPADSCYSFWVGSAIKIAFPELLDNINVEPAVEFVLQCENLLIGGFAKTPKNFPDLMHSHFSLFGLSLMKSKHFSLAEVVPHVGITRRAFESCEMNSYFLASGKVNTIIAEE
eukprot:snap_masked-scaffold_9-processed-gene-2.35-mRNA-1 protein AED:0.85 eAED:0.85 QI:0/-1/0/1/-1/1/1/0/380